MPIEVAQSCLSAVNEIDRLTQTDLGIQTLVRGCLTTILIWGVVLWRVIVEAIPVYEVLDDHWYRKRD